MVRLEPAGTVIVPAATPLVMSMLNTSGVVISGAVTCTTTTATRVPETSARSARAASPTDEDSSPLRLLQAAKTASTTRTNDANLGWLRHMARGPFGSVDLESASSAPATQ